MIQKNVAREEKRWQLEYECKAVAIKH